MRVVMFMLPALAAALMPRVPLAPASRAAAATAAVRTSRPVMLVEVSEAVVQSGLAVVDMPLMTLGDVGLVESVKALPPVAQGVYCAQRHDLNLPILTSIPPAARPTREHEPEPEPEPASSPNLLHGDKPNGLLPRSLVTLTLTLTRSRGVPRRRPGVRAGGQDLLTLTLTLTLTQP